MGQNLPQPGIGFPSLAALETDFSTGAFQTVNPHAETRPENEPSGDFLRILRQDLTAELTLGLLHKINNLLTRIHFQVEDSQALLPPSHPVSAHIAGLSENIAGIQALLERTSQINLPTSEQDTCPIYDLEASLRQHLDLLKILLPQAQIRSVSEDALLIQPGLREGEFGLLLLQLACVLRSLSIPKRAAVSLDLLRGDQIQPPPADLPWPPQGVVMIQIQSSEPPAQPTSATLARIQHLAGTLGCRIVCPPENPGCLLLVLPHCPNPN